jgi:hypothetical protein
MKAAGSERRLNNAPGLMTDLANIRSADANTKRQGMRIPEAKT